MYRSNAHNCLPSNSSLPKYTMDGSTHVTHHSNCYGFNGSLWLCLNEISLRGGVVLKIDIKKEEEEEERKKSYYQ